MVFYLVKPPMVVSKDMAEGSHGSLLSQLGLKGSPSQPALQPSPAPSRVGNTILPAQTTCYVPDILDSRFPVSFLSPDFEAVHQQDDELAILHADGHHLPVRAVGRTPGRVAQVHLVKQLLRGHRGTCPEPPPPGLVSPGKPVPRPARSGCPCRCGAPGPPALSRSRGGQHARSRPAREATRVRAALGEFFPKGPGWRCRGLRRAPQLCPRVPESGEPGRLRRNRPRGLRLAPVLLREELELRRLAVRIPNPDRH